MMGREEINTILTMVALILQIGVVVYGIKMIRLVKWLDNWTPAWIVFVLASGSILCRRAFWLLQYMSHTPSDPELESMLTVFVSILLLLFVLFMHKTFMRYLKKNGNKGPNEE